MARRPHMGLRVQRDACLWALGIDPNDVDFHHDPILAARPIDPLTGDTIPAANDPKHITPMLRADHKARTPADIKTVAKVKRLEAKEAAFRIDSLNSCDSETIGVRGRCLSSRSHRAGGQRAGRSQRG